MPNIDKEIKAKIAMLDYTTSKLQAAIDTEEQELLLRQLKAVKTVMESCEKLRIDATQSLFDKEATDEEIDQFNQYVQDKLMKGDASGHAFNQWFAKKKQKNDELKSQCEIEALNKKYELVLKLAKEKQTSAAKLPRVEIADFNGSPLDWLRFWGLFVKNVDERNIPSSDKMSYLVGYLVPKVRECIVGLDYDKQGYKMAKEILERKYGDKSMVVNAYVSEIMDLPHTSGANPRKIKEFHTTLSRSVKALGAMGKLHEVKGLVVKTLDKLPNIKGGLSAK